MNDDTLYKIALSLIPTVGPVNARILVSYCGGVEAVFREKKNTLLKINGIGESIASQVKSAEVFEKAQQQYDYIQENGAKAIFFLDKAYPERLKHIKDAPILLYFKGNADLNVPRCLGVVGTRKPTQEGKAITDAILSELKPYDVTIISGLAYGIDITAHRRAVLEGMTTIGVMGTGIDTVYPPAHSQTATQMIENGGLLSEFTINCKPDAVHFPMRNRIIAGMSDAVLVVESAIKGGSMITAELALGYHKELFAIPGRVQDQFSRGCNELIKKQKAQLVESGEELAKYMQWDLSSKRNIAVQKQLFVDLSKEEETIIAFMDPGTEISIDKIYNNLTWSPSKVASVLLNLEFKGLVRSLPGKRYTLAP